jgi:hypothetical protein
MIAIGLIAVSILLTFAFFGGIRGGGNPADAGRVYLVRDEIHPLEPDDYYYHRWSTDRTGALHFSARDENGKAFEACLQVDEPGPPPAPAASTDRLCGSASDLFDGARVGGGQYRLGMHCFETEVGCKITYSVWLGP